MIHFLEASSDYLTISEYLDFRGRAVAARFSVRNYEELATWRSAPAGTYVFADLDHLTPAGTRLAAELADQLVESGSGLRLLNFPGRTLLRRELLEELHRRGLNRFRAVRAVDDYRGLRYPVFVREEHGHSGPLSPLLATPKEVEAGLGSAIARGRRLSELLVVEFCDTADADGFYRKYGAYRVGSEIIPQNLAYGRDWVQKWASTEFSEPMMREQEAYVLENPHEEQLRRIFEIARTEYGRIDYAVENGRVQTWEINLNPTVDVGQRGGNFPADLERFREGTKRHFYGRLQKAWEAVDSGATALVAIPIRYSAESLRDAWKMTSVKKQSRWKRALRKRLRPLRPAVMSIGRTLSPILVRLARRAG